MLRITQELAARFAAPLEGGWARRIVVWLDEDGEFADAVSEAAPQGVRLLVMEENRSFALRRQIESDYAQENILLYCPTAFERPQDNWLLDVFLYSESFRADYWSLLFAEMGIENTRPMRDYARGAKAFFRSRERREKLRALGGKIADVSALREGMLQVACGLKGGGLCAVLRAVLACDPDEENAPLLAMEKLCGPDAFWEAVAETYGYTGARKAGQLAAYLLVCAASSGSAGKALAGLPGSGGDAPAAYGFFVEALREDRDGLLRLCHAVEEEYGVASRLVKLERAELLAHAVFPCADALLLLALLDAFADGRLNPDEAEATLAVRRGMPWFSLYAPYYDALRALTDMQLFYQANRQGFHFASADATWRAYEKTLHAMDQAYRRFVIAYQAALREGIFQLEDDLKAASDAAERLYKNWYLAELCALWSEQLAAMDGELALRAAPQEQFYSKYVKAAPGRVFVVISDALRYETAAELTARLNARFSGNAQVSALRAAYPTVTPVGMAALLPHLSLTLEDDMRVRCDGMSAHSGGREAILQAACPQSATIEYEALRQMNRAERAELVRGLKIVYIYHDAIDRAGEAGNDVFAACEQAMDELTQLMRILVGEMSASTVYITSDHGFLYTRAPLEEYDKAGRELVGDDALVYARRHAIVRGTAKSDALLALPLTLLGRPEWTALFPRGNLRFRLQGGSGTYMHGGLSLQEMAVPLIAYENKRAGQKGYQPIDRVDVVLSSAARKISNNIFTLTFYQAQPCSQKMQPRTVAARMEDAQGNPVSDAHRIVADSATTDNSQRAIRATFRLTGSEYDRRAAYFLVMTDEQTGETLAKEEFTIDIAFAQDFDF